MRVASMLISLDGIDVLNSQHEIRRFLLETDIPLQQLLPKAAKLGRAVVSLLFCPDHAEQVKRHETGVVLAKSFEELLGYDVLTWELRSAGAATHRLTAAAYAALLEYAPSVEVVEVLLRKPLLSAISTILTLEGSQAAEVFLCQVLENLQSSDTLVLSILKILSSKEEEIVKVMKPLSSKLRAAHLSLFSSSSNPFLPALYSALQSESLGNYLAMVAHGTEKGRPLQLSLDSCTMLQDLYIQYFRQAMKEISNASIDSSYSIHKAMLDDASCASLFVRLSDMKEQNPSDLALLWYCWRQSPDRQLPFWALPSAQLGSFFVYALNTGNQGLVWSGLVAFQGRKHSFSCKSVTVLLYSIQFYTWLQSETSSNYWTFHVSRQAESWSPSRNQEAGLLWIGANPCASVSRSWGSSWLHPRRCHWVSTTPWPRRPPGSTLGVAAPPSKWKPYCLGKKTRRQFFFQVLDDSDRENLASAWLLCIKHEVFSRAQRR